MNKLSVHMRISGLTPTDEDVNSRQKAIVRLASAWSKIGNRNAITAKAAEIATALGGQGVPPQTLSMEVENAIQKFSAAFLSAERPLEVGVCAGMAANQVMVPKTGAGASGLAVPDVYSHALWLALSFQPVLQEEKREALRREILEDARQRSLDSSTKAREREIIPDVPELDTPIDEKGITTNFQKIASEIINPLQRNAVLDREELDFLWWAQLDRSRILGRRLADIPEATRLVTMGIEGAALLRRFPADVHREIVLRTVDADPELDLGELVKAIGGDLAALVERIPAKVTATPAVYPLLNALVTGASEGEGAQEKRKASTWGCRALLETAMARMTSEGRGQR